MGFTIRFVLVSVRHTIIEMRTVAVEDEWSLAVIRDRDKTKEDLHAWVST